MWPNSYAVLVAVIPLLALDRARAMAATTKSGAATLTPAAPPAEA
jgi:hypothetical protein